MELFILMLCLTVSQTGLASAQGEDLLRDFDTLSQTGLASAQGEDLLRDFDTRQATLAVLNPDEQCRRTYGNGSYLCRENYNSGGYDYLCSSFFCYNPSTKACMFSRQPGDKTPCGNGKWCVSHSCQADSNATVTSDDCPLGDSTKPNVLLDLSCEEIKRDHPYLCSNLAVKNLWCCDSCLNTTVPDPLIFPGPAVQVNDYCQRLFGIQSYFCMSDAHYNSSYSSICLNTYCYDAVDYTCKPIPAENGIPCGDGQWCVGGKCITSLLAPANPDADCLYGSCFGAYCVANIKYPNIARLCSQSGYETGCCAECLQHKNTSHPAGCEYGDLHPDTCQQEVTAGSIATYCRTNEAQCCETCAALKDNTNANCPFGDANVAQCEALMKDNVGPGNCYSGTQQKQCCDTCQTYYNASKPGCVYGDHWKDYCAGRVKPPNVAAECSNFEVQCCGSCEKYKQHGRPGCEYGDRDPAACNALLHNSTLGSANCYSIIHYTQCCLTCGDLRNPSMSGCMYGDRNPSRCENLMTDANGPANCYNNTVMSDCCRTCPELRNSTRPGCEYGDRQPDYCNTTIVDGRSAHLCFNYEHICCESCADYAVSHLSDCKYGDRNPLQCGYQIPNEATAARRCPQLEGNCCATCSKFGHPGPSGGIPKNLLSIFPVG